MAPALSFQRAGTARNKKHTDAFFRDVRTSRSYCLKLGLIIKATFSASI
jgi:hypothetical protein